MPWNWAEVLSFVCMLECCLVMMMPSRGMPWGNCWGPGARVWRKWLILSLLPQQCLYTQSGAFMDFLKPARGLGLKTQAVMSVQLVVGPHFECPCCEDGDRPSVSEEALKVTLKHGKAWEPLPYRNAIRKLQLNTILLVYLRVGLFCFFFK